MNMRWIVPAGLLLVAVQAGAQPVEADAQAAANEANRSEALINPHPSPRQRAELERAAQAQRNQQLGDAQLASNGSRAGVTTLPGGVEYRILKAGSGKRPTDASTVLCRYKGTLSDGTVFDQSDAKAPAPLKVAGLLPGLRDAVKQMPVGSQWEVVVPPQLGYGARGAEGVGPNAVLTYLVELVAIQ